MPYDIDIGIRATGTLIKVGSKAVEKKYTREDRVLRLHHLVHIYQLLHEKNVPNVDHILQYYCDDEHGTVAFLAPKGMDQNPRTPQDVTNAVKCVLEALEVREIWGFQTCSELIGAEYNRLCMLCRILFFTAIYVGGISFEVPPIGTSGSLSTGMTHPPPTRAVKHLAQHTHCPSVFDDDHGAEVDIWSTGKLILDAPVFASQIPAEVTAIGRSMVEGRISTATEALDELAHCIES